MKRWFWMVLTAAALATAGCASQRMPADQAKAEQPASPAPVPLAANEIKAKDAEGAMVIQKLEFRAGVSSSTVERLGKQYGCTSRIGAGLVTEKGPVEVYRMVCDNGKTFLAQCELRQCRPMR